MLKDAVVSSRQALLLCAQPLQPLPLYVLQLSGYILTMDVALGKHVGFKLTEALTRTLLLDISSARPRSFIFFLGLTTLYAPFIYQMASRDSLLSMASGGYIDPSTEAQDSAQTSEGHALQASSLGVLKPTCRLISFIHRSAGREGTHGDMAMEVEVVRRSPLAPMVMV